MAEEIDDPTAILTQLKFQDLYTPRNFQTTAQTNTFLIRPLIPVEPFALMPVKQIIRPTFSIQTLATSSGSSTTTQFADMDLFDLFLSNWPDPNVTGFGWGIGPTFVFPTGRVPKAGKHAWQVGPAAAAVYRGIPHLMVGFLFQDPISFAYTNSSATPQSQMEFQPLISYTIGHITPMYTVRFGVTLLFPNFELSEFIVRWYNSRAEVRATESAVFRCGHKCLDA